MTTIFIDIALILSLTAVLAAIFGRLRQPVLLAYLLVGILAASSGIFKEVTSGATLDFFAELGIAFALFLIGLELKFSSIKQIGRAAVYLGLGQIIFTTIVGFFLGRAIGFSSGEALYIAAALTFSSTIIVIKLLEQKRDLNSLYGNIATGYLIVQDFVAVAALIFVASLGKGGGAEVGEFAKTAIAGVFLVALVLFLNRFVLQSAFDLLAKNTEVLFLASISWALIFAALSVALGFSIEIGAFLAGLGLATLREEQQIASWIRPLRNLFIILFFLSLGLKLSLATILSITGLVIALSIFVLLGNPLIMMIIMGILGFRRRTSFHVAVTSGQISEFSLIFVALGSRLELVGEKVVNSVIAVAIVTIALSTYSIIYSSKIYKNLAPYLKVFQRKALSEKPIGEEKEFSDHVILVGAGRLGQNLLKNLRKKGYEVVVVDFNPNVVKALERVQIPVIYGDVSDLEILEKAIGKNPKLVISTVVSGEDTDHLLTEVKELTGKVPLVVTAPSPSQAMAYYKKGASYVIVPRILSSNLIEKFLFTRDFEDLKEGTLRREHLEELSNNNLESL
jgi:Kef-type K+ transport system membrane component KefB/Trk K+ transport system NAD-binding subunit